MKIKTGRTILGIGFVIAMTGCTSLVSTPNTQNIIIQSKQSDVRVYLNGNDMGTTPIALEYNRKIQPCVVLVKDGYDPCQLRIRRQATSRAHFDGIMTLIPYVDIIGTFALFDFCRPGCLVEYAATNVMVDLDNKKPTPKWDLRPFDEINDRDRAKGVPTL